MAQLPNIQKGTMVYLLICIGIPVAFIVAGIYPNYRIAAGLDADIQSIREKLETQQTLLPLYINLLQQAKVKKIEGLPLADKGKLKQENISRMMNVFQEMAQKSNLIFDGGVPDVNSLVSGSANMMFSLSVKGSYSDCRSFLIRMGSVPYLERIESLRLFPDEGIKKMSMKIWLALEQ
jgi:hypothetical protein